MSAEQRWSDRREWEVERGEIEIKSHWVISSEWNEQCDAQRCMGVATFGIEVGLIGSRGGSKFSFCMNHNDDDFAFDVYRRMRQ